MNKKSEEKSKLKPINSVEISNFTVFKKNEIQFSKGLNIFIGKNGTGKTHLLKLINCLDNNFYTLAKENKKYKSEEDDIKTFSVIDSKSFPIPSSFLKLYNKYVYSNDAKKEMFNSKKILVKFNKYISLQLDNRIYSFVPHNRNGITINTKVFKREFFLKYKKTYKLKNNKFTFIPCKDILTSSKGFSALYDSRYINFESVYYNIIKKSELPIIRDLDEDFINIAKKIEEAIGGKAIYKNNYFLMDYKNIGEIYFDMVAEGHKKLALIYILIMNGEIDKNTVLLLDEPESNLNPQLTDLLVEILLSLSKLGCQIFIATHNTFILDDIEIQRKKEHKILYHSFYFDDKNKANGVNIETKEFLKDLEHNDIEEKIIKQHNDYLDKEFS